MSSLRNNSLKVTLHLTTSLGLANVKKLYKDGRLILTENSLERLLVYFDGNRIL